MAKKLSDLPGLLAGACLPPDSVGAHDAAELAAAAPRIVAAVSDLMDKVRSGELAPDPSADSKAGAEGDRALRAGWL